MVWFTIKTIVNTLLHLKTVEVKRTTLVNSNKCFEQVKLLYLELYRYVTYYVWRVLFYCILHIKHEFIHEIGTCNFCKLINIIIQNQWWMDFIQTIFRIYFLFLKTVFLYCSTLRYNCCQGMRCTIFWVGIFVTITICREHWECWLH